MIKGLPPKRETKETTKQETKVETKKVLLAPKQTEQEVKVIDPKKEDKPKPKLKLKLNNTEALAQEEEVNIEFDPKDDLTFPKEFYEIEGFDANFFEQNVMQLGEELQKENPSIRSYLKHIMQNLHSYPEVNHLLNDKQLSLVVSGFKKQRGVEITAKKPSQTSAMKEMQKLTNAEILGAEW